MECALTSKLSARLIGLFNFSMSKSLQSKTPFPEEPIPALPLVQYINTHINLSSVHPGFFIPSESHSIFPPPMSLDHQQDQKPLPLLCEHSLDLQFFFS